MARTTIVMTDELQEEAKELGLNVSEICRDSVAEAVTFRKASNAHGDDFKSVVAVFEHRDTGLQERVEFVGRLVHTDHSRADTYYVTAGGRPAIVDAAGCLFHADTVDEMGLQGAERQLMTEALGEVPKPTLLDI